MNSQRVKALMGATILGSAAALALTAAPAAAQISDQTMLNILRECAKIGDANARLACYDNNLRLGGSSGGTVVTGGGNGGQIGGFGADSVRTDDRFKSSSERGQGPDAVRTKVTKVRQIQQGVWVVTVEDGGEWTFGESVDRSFREPRVGALVEISRASLGSFLMVVDGQGAVRVRRTK